MAQLNYSAIFSRVKSFVLSPFAAEIHGSNVRPPKREGRGEIFHFVGI